MRVAMIASLPATLVNKPDQNRLEDAVAKDALVSQELADKFKTEKDSPYLRFVRGEGLDIISAQYVPNLRTVELKPWARKNGKGVFINHEASRTSNDCYVCEIGPGKKSEPQHHLFEEMILVLSGRGSTSVWNNAGARVGFEWKAGAIFAIPLNCWYQHFNGSGQEPVRYVAVTNAPSCSIICTTSRGGSPASPTITARRASRLVSCCRPILSPTR
jgi:mannose-6-phosphate isomerase-like protein (cupin superfamily)